MFIFDLKIYHHSGIKDENLGEYIHYLDHYVKQLKNAIITNYNNEDIYKWLNEYKILNVLVNGIANIVYRIESIRIKTINNITNFDKDGNGDLYNKIYRDTMKVEESPKIILDNKLFCEIMGNIMDCIIIVYSSPHMDDPDYVYGHDKTKTIYSYLRWLDSDAYNNPPLREAVNYIKDHYMDRLVAHINLNR